MAGKKVKGETQASAGSDSKSPAAVSSISEKVTEFREFLEESKVELKKVTWPTRKETTATATAVLVLVVVMSLFLGVVDLGLSRLIEKILS